MKKIILMMLFMVLTIGVFAQENNLNVQNLVKFPYDRLENDMYDPALENVITYRIDPYNGNDKNSGKTWSTAKKTISSIMNELPYDMMKVKVRIFIKSGILNDNIDIKKNNAEFNIYWIGTWCNYSDTVTGRTAWANYVRAGQNISPFTDSVTIIRSATASKPIFLIENSFNTLVNWNRTDRVLEHYGRIVFDSINIANDGAINSWANNNVTVEFFECIFLLGASNYQYINSWGGNSYYRFGSCQFIGGSGGNSKSTGYWNGLIQTGNGNKDYFGSVWNSRAFDSRFSYNTNSSITNLVIGIKKVANLDNSSNFGLIYNWRKGNLSDSTKPIVYINSGFSGTAWLDTNYMSFTNVSIQPHIVSYNGITTQALTPGFISYPNKFKLNSIDTSRTWTSGSDSIRVKVNVNGIDYWLKLVK